MYNRNLFSTFARATHAVRTREDLLEVTRMRDLLLQQIKTSSAPRARKKQIKEDISFIYADTTWLAKDREKEL